MCEIQEKKTKLNGTKLCERFNFASGKLWKSKKKDSKSWHTALSSTCWEPVPGEYRKLYSFIIKCLLSVYYVSGIVVG